MTNTTHQPIKLFQFPRMFAIPNLSPFCCKLETWLRIARIPYEVVDTPDPRKGPKGKLPFIEDAGLRIADTSVIVDYLITTRGVDPDAISTRSNERSLSLFSAHSRSTMHLCWRTRTWSGTRACNTRAPGLSRCLRLSAPWWRTLFAHESKSCSGTKASCATRTKTSLRRLYVIGAPY